MIEGIVYRSTGSWYEVKAQDGQFYDCKIKGKFRIKGIKSTNPIAVGDRVSFQLIVSEEKTIGWIENIHPRDNYIVRKSVNLSKQTHIIAANIDQAFLLITLNNPPTFYPFIDRFIITAQAYKIPVVLLFNKMDIYDATQHAQVEEMIRVYQNIGIECHRLSCLNAQDVVSVSKLMHQKVSMFSGHSGVGKSTLLNAIDPNLNLKTNSVSEQHNQGQHTTTYAQMFDLKNEAKIIDTPGIKGFGVVDIAIEELGDYFVEFFALKSECKFNNCIHVDEPHCAIKSAVEEGEIAYSRYQSYLQLLEEDTPYRS